MEHRLVDVATSMRTGRAAATCSCGWATHHFPTAGLAETLLAAHVRREAARTVRVGAALADLERLGRDTAVAERARLDTVAGAVTARYRSPARVQPPAFGVTTVAIVSANVAARRQVATLLAGNDECCFLGEGSTGADAVALAVVELPDLLVVEDGLGDMQTVEAFRLIRALRVESRLCLSTDSGGDGSEADLVLAGAGASELVDWLALGSAAAR